jgi:hypothetical protein
MRVYFSSKVRHAETWKALRAALLPLGIDNSSSWVDWEGNLQGGDRPSAAQWQGIGRTSPTMYVPATF